jgi:hypothetical protein
MNNWWEILLSLPKRGSTFESWVMKGENKDHHFKDFFRDEEI